MAPHPSTCRTSRMMVAPMVSRRLLLHPAEALAGHIGPETPVVPSQSLRSPLSVEAIQEPWLSPMKAWRLRSAGSWTAVPMAAVCAFPKALPVTVSMATAWTSLACPVSTSTSVMKLRQPPHSVSMHAASIPMAPSDVSAAQDLHPRTNHITVRLRDPGPEHLCLASHYACALGASRARLPSSSLQVCKDVSQSGFRMDRHRGMPFTAPVIPAPPTGALGLAWSSPGSSVIFLALL